MSDPTDKSNPTKVEPFVVEKGLMSLEELDRNIQENDPEALAKLDALKSSTELNNQTLVLHQFDDINGDPKKGKNKKWEQFTFKSRLFLRWLQAKSTDLFFKTLESSKKTLQILKQKKAQTQARTRHWTKKDKLLFNSLILVVISIPLFVYFAFYKKALNYKSELFIPSLLTVADHVWNAQEDQMREGFYNNLIIPKNIFSLRKMVINLQPSENSGPNPMVAYELSLEANSREALVEIKDREGEVIDGVQRSLEELTYDELSGPEGRRLVEDKVKNQVNQILTLGKVRSVYVVGVIFKR